MRRYIDLIRNLTEAPLADLQLHGDWSDDRSHIGPRTSTPEPADNSFVSRIDRAMVRSPSFGVRVTKAFSRCPTKFYLFLINSSGMNFFLRNLDYGVINPDDDENMGRFPPQLIEALREGEDGIRVILTHNDGGSTRHAMTPWIVAHRTAHAIMGNNPVEEMLFNNINKRILEMFSRIREDGGVSLSQDAFLGSICTFGSARNNNISLLDIGDHTELYAELMTQYITSGKITFKVPEDVLDGQAIIATNEVRTVIVHAVDSFRIALEELFANVLTNAVGKICIC